MLRQQTCLKYARNLCPKKYAIQILQLLAKTRHGSDVAYLTHSPVMSLSLFLPAFCYF